MSRKVLYITANPKAEKESFSLQVGRKFIEEYKKQNPADDVTELDLFATKVPHLNAAVFQAFGKLQNGGSFEDLNEEQKLHLGELNKMLEQFMNSDAYVFVNPMWNFSIPPVLKAYIDVIMQAGKTFRYTKSGPEGLLKGKKAIHVQASGGVYTNGAGVDMEFGHHYLKTILGFIGITDLNFIAVEGVASGEKSGSEILAYAEERAMQLAVKF